MLLYLFGWCGSITSASAITTLRPNMRFTIATPTAYDVVMNSIVSPASFGWETIL